jgi:hypothetical protein
VRSDKIKLGWQHLALEPLLCLWNGATAVEAQNVNARRTRPEFNPVHVQMLLCGSIQ